MNTGGLLIIVIGLVLLWATVTGKFDVFLSALMTAAKSDSSDGATPDKAVSTKPIAPPATGREAYAQLFV